MITSLLAATKTLVPTGGWLSLWGGLEDWQQVLAILVGGLLLHLIIRFGVLRGMKRVADATDNDLDDRLVQFFGKFYIIGLLLLIGALILKALGIAITPLLASAGILGIAIAMAAKETLSDILAGVFLIMDRPIAKGDRIMLDRIGKHWGSWGDVVDIGLRRTKIRTTDAVVVNYPNNIIANSVITNFSNEKEPVRARVRFQVGYEADIDLVETLVKRATEGIEGVMPETTETVVRGLWDDDGGHVFSGVLLETRYLLENVKERTRTRSRVLKAILVVLRENGVEMARQTLEVRGKVENS